MSKDRDALIMERVQDANRRTAQARQVPIVAKARSALADVDLSIAEDSLATKVRELLPELDRWSDGGDRWALARLFDELRRAGCPYVRLARLLIRAGIRPGALTIRNVARTGDWVRKELERYRSETRPTEPNVDGAGERHGLPVLVLRTVTTEVISETVTPPRSK